MPASDWTPDRKVSIGAGAIGVPLGIVVTFALQEFGIEVPAEVGAAIGSLLSTLAAYFVPSAS